jgi:hypothetical protein
MALTSIQTSPPGSLAANGRAMYLKVCESSDFNHAAVRCGKL